MQGFGGSGFHLGGSPRLGPDDLRLFEVEVHAALEDHHGHT